MPEGFISTSSDSLLASVGQAPIRETREQADARGIEADRKRAERGGEGVDNPLYKPPLVKKPTAPKLPVKPVKVDVKTGKGVPGGFDAASIKKPSVDIAKYTSAIATVASQMSKLKSLKGAAALSPELGTIISPLKSKLSGAISSYSKKVKDAKKSAVDFAQTAKIPKLPQVPKIDVPELPPLPDVPEAPTIPGVSVPTPGSIPGISTNLSLPSAPEIPKLGI